MNITDIVVAELRKSMESAIPQVVRFLLHAHDINGDLRRTGTNVLLNLLQEGSIFNSPMLMSLTQ